MAVGVDNLRNLKTAIIERFNKQLLRMQMGHPYKKSKTLQRAIDLVEFLEDCPDDKCYDIPVNNMIDKLYFDLH